MSGSLKNESLVLLLFSLKMSKKLVLISVRYFLKTSSYSGRNFLLLAILADSTMRRTANEVRFSIASSSGIYKASTYLCALFTIGLESFSSLNVIICKDFLSTVFLMNLLNCRISGFQRASFLICWMTFTLSDSSFSFGVLLFIVWVGIIRVRSGKLVVSVRIIVAAREWS